MSRIENKGKWSLWRMSQALLLSSSSIASCSSYKSLSEVSYICPFTLSVLLSTRLKNTYKDENLSQRSFLGHPVNVSTILPYTDHWHYFRMTKEKPGRRRKKEKPGHLRSRRLMSTMFTSRFRGISPTLGIGLGQGSNSFWWTLSRVPLSVMLVVEVESTWVLTLCCTVLERIDVEVSAS